MRESLELEFKAARGGVPNDLWPTVCAFANTNGGWIVLGVAESGGQFSIQGVNNADSMLKHIHDSLRNTNKISFPACGASDVGVERVGDADLVVIRVPAAARKDKPVYLNANPYHGTYLRRHSGDYRCTKFEVDRMMRDASDGSTD
jgi:ATP-dependent DNA helicase RecG